LNTQHNHNLPDAFKKFVFQITATVSFFLLVSCGGSGSSEPAASSGFSVGGNVSGLTAPLTIQNNNGDTQSITANGRYAFVKRLSNAESYNVEIIQNVATQNCSIANASGQINNANVINVDIVCTSGTKSLSGSYRAAPLIQVDSDINDPFALPNVDNGSFATAQKVPNFSTIQGFATLSGTGRFIEGDRLATTADEFDIYKVVLQKNQVLRLQVVDFAGEDVFTGDLDLFLFDLALNQLRFSNTRDEFESITVPDDGEYYIQVETFSGSSKYTLSLGGVSVLNAPASQSMDFKPGEAVIQFKASASVNQFKASNQLMNLSHQHTTRAALAKFEVSASRAFISSKVQAPASAFLQELAQANPASYQKYQTLKQIKRLNQRADIKFAEPNYIYQSLLVPNDEHYPMQWHYPAINLPLAWNITTGSRIGGGDVIVAVVDTGVFLEHDEFVGQLVNGYDFISDAQMAADGDGIDANPDDPGDSAQLSSSSWHGTHVAGTVAALSNNNSGIAGVAWNAKIMPIRVLGIGGGTDYDIIQSIRFAAGLGNDSNTVPAQKADIINLSLGGTGSSQAAQDAYNAVRAAGVIVVAAAGNENTNLLSYPASYDGVISVSATDFADNRAPYSNFGTRIDIAAPGGNQAVDLNNDGQGDGVLSALVDDSTGIRKPAFTFYQGTSMAAPHVAGVFALMRAVHPTISPVDIDSLLANGGLTTDIGDAGRDDDFGFGLIDALKAVQAAQTLANGGVALPQPALIVATPSQLDMGEAVIATLTLSNLGEDSTNVTSFSADVAWLTISVSSVDANGLGDYQITIINREELNNSLYVATITFNLATGNTVIVPVSMRVGDFDSAGNAGKIYMLLLDANNNVVADASVVDRGNGEFDYSFTNIVPGAYRIVAGSDIDNDLFICQLGEACGGFPTLNALSPIKLESTDITGLDFVVDILANFGTSSLSLEVGTRPAGIGRTVIKGKQIKSGR